jgi:hypothetical protein
MMRLSDQDIRDFLDCPDFNVEKRFMNIKNTFLPPGIIYFDMVLLPVVIKG